MKAKMNIEGVEVELDGNQNELLETIKNLTKKHLARDTKEPVCPNIDDNNYARFSKKQKENVDYLISLDGDGYAKTLIYLYPQKKGIYHRWKKKELQEIKRDLAEGKSISEISRKFGVTPVTISSQVCKKMLLPESNEITEEEHTVYRRQNKEYRNKIKKAVALSKETGITLREALKKVFPEQSSIGGGDYSIARELGYETPLSYVTGEYQRYLAERGKWVCSRTNYLMRNNPAWTREQAMTEASTEFRLKKNLYEQPKPNTENEDEKLVTATPQVEVVEEYPDNNKFKKAVTALTNGNGRTGELPRIEGMNQELKPILIGVIRNAVREGNEMTFKELSYPLGINTLDDWNAFVESFMHNAQKIANHFNVQNKFELMIRRGEKMIRYNKVN